MAKNQAPKQDASPSASTAVSDAPAPSDGGSGASDALATAGAAPVAPVPPAVVASTSRAVRVLVAATIGAVSCDPADVLEGVPDEVIAAYSGELDSHPDAVTHALASGAPVKQYAAAQAAE